MNLKETVINLFPKPIVLIENVFLEKLNVLEIFLKQQIK